MKTHVPLLSKDHQEQLSRYVEEHIEAFTQTKILQPISPRGMLAVAKAAVIFGDLRKALELSVLDRASGDDRTVLKGLVDRAVK